VVVDAVSGASDELMPKEVHFDFTLSGRVVAARRAYYLETHVDLNKKTAFAIQHGMPIKGMTTEQLIACLGEPDRIEEKKNTTEYTYNQLESPCLVIKKDRLVRIKKG